MMDVAVVGFMFGSALMLLWVAYYFTYMPKSFKRWILSNKYRVLALDVVIILLGNITLNKFTGTIVSAIATLSFGLMCFAFSFTMICISRLSSFVKSSGRYG